MRPNQILKSISCDQTEWNLEDRFCFVLFYFFKVKVCLRNSHKSATLTLWPQGATAPSASFWDPPQHLSWSLTSHRLPSVKDWMNTANEQKKGHFQDPGEFGLKIPLCQALQSCGAAWGTFPQPSFLYSLPHLQWIWVRFQSLPAYSNFLSRLPHRHFP
jgi:hypothetical protein